MDLEIANRLLNPQGGVWSYFPVEGWTATCIFCGATAPVGEDGSHALLEADPFDHEFDGEQPCLYAEALRVVEQAKKALNEEAT